MPWATAEPTPMRIVAYRGEVEEDDFYEQYMTAAGMLSRMQEYLADGLKNDPEVQALFSTARAAPPAPSAPASPGASGARGQSRGDGKPSKKRKGVPVSAPEVQLKGTLVDGAQGAQVVELDFGSAERLSGAKQGQLFRYLIEKLEFRVRSETFRVVDVTADGDDVAVSGYLSASKGAESKEILDALIPLPFTALARFIDLNNKGKELSVKDTASVKKLLLSGDRPRAIFLKGTTDWPASLPKFPDTPASVILLWLPDQIPLLFYDLVHSGTLYKLYSKIYRPAIYGDAYNAGLLTANNWDAAATARISGDRYPFYSVDDKGKLWSAALTKPKGAWGTDGVGGQGAMRCDAKREYECSVEDRTGKLGRALGLSSVVLADDAITQNLTYPSAGLAIHKFAYSKAYLTQVPKKNRPRETRPLSFLWKEMYGMATAPRQKLKQTLKLSGFVMKQKGDGPAGSTPGQPLGKPMADREAANVVMRDAIKARFGDAIGNQSLDGWQGSATQFAEKVFNADEVVCGFWKEHSEGLEQLDGTAASDELMSSVRTDQEWCHLFGHGDGGSETPDNFVCGSKHCNSEQLALELVQRFYRENALTAKITAYLMPSGLPANSVKWSLCKKKYRGLATAVGPIVDKTPAAVDRGRQMRIELGKYFDSNLRTKGMSGPMLAQKRGAFIEEVLNALFPTVPMAYMMRYKVYTARGSKCVDHLYSGQREEMDYSEFQALQWAFRLRIAKGIDGRGPLYQEVTDLLDKKIAALTPPQAMDDL